MTATDPRPGLAAKLAARLAPAAEALARCLNGVGSGGSGSEAGATVNASGRKPKSGQLHA